MSLMSGKLIDLSQPDFFVPNPVVVDTSVVVALLPTSSLSAPLQAAQASSFFRQLLSTNRHALITPTAFSEFIHIAIKFHYTTVLKALGKGALSQQPGVQIRNWLDLLKYDPSILQRYASNLAALQRAIIAHNVVIMDPDQLGTIASGRTHQEELLQAVSH